MPTPIENEILILKSIIEIIDEMVNNQMFVLIDQEPDSSILFTSTAHKRYFNIILVDFLSKTDRKGPIEQVAFLAGLRKIIEKPSFNFGDSIASLETTSNELINWLNTIAEIDVWSNILSFETTIKISRLELLKMSGDLSKHHYLRAIGVAKKIQLLLKESGVDVSDNDSLLLLPEFYDRFHEDILAYHSSTIASYLNNIRWGIYEYLQPQLQISTVWDKEIVDKYSYDIPAGIESHFYEQGYWGLMNSVRSKPLVKRFNCVKWLKRKY